MIKFALSRGAQRGALSINRITKRPNGRSQKAKKFAKGGARFRFFRPPP
jgi:hypothetical protein